MMSQFRGGGIGGGMRKVIRNAPAKRRFSSGERPGDESRGEGRSSGRSRFARPSHGDRRSVGAGGHRGGFGGGHGPSRSSGGFRGGGSRGGSRGGGGRGGAGRRRGGAYIDPSRFIRKASALPQNEPKYVPKHSFADFQIVTALKQNIIGKGYTTPTPIQDQAIPEVLNGRDIVGIANTGTGKTGAFLIPLIDKCAKNKNESVLIVVPTRELATQIEDELRGFTRGMHMYSVVCVGGMGIIPQVKKLRMHNSFVIGTPGRLKDLINRGSLRLGSFGTIVLDEADRMLDMGFLPDMHFIMEQMPKVRHTLFFSATLEKEIEAIIHKFLKDPVRIMLKVRETSDTVDQDVVRVSRDRKFETLVSMLRDPEYKKVLVFGEMKHQVERLAKMLVAEGIRAESIHGNKTQSHRQRSLDLFRSHHVNVLVATDVAARGIDIQNVSHVINYDVPNTYEDYVHRIGRTGRAGKTGKALTFIEG